MNIIRNCSVLAAILATTASAYAADISTPISPASFEGFYAGAFAGYGAAKIEGIQDSGETVACERGGVACPEQAEQFDGDWQGTAAVGGYFGYNMQHSSFVFGLEGDIGFGDINDEAVDAEGNDLATQEVEWFGSLRGRLGMLAGEATMVYATGGVGYISTVYTAYNNIDRSSRQINDEHIGAFTAVVGAGVEHLVNEHVALRLEGMYFFPTSEHEFDEDELSDDMDDGDYAQIGGLYQVRAGLSFKF